MSEMRELDEKAKLRILDHDGWEAAAHAYAECFPDATDITFDGLRNAIRAYLDATLPKEDGDGKRSKRSFSDLMFDFHAAESEFEAALIEAGVDDWDHMGGDDYDCSLELYKVPNDTRLSEAALDVVFNAGFIKLYVNHQDGWETHYSSNKRRGWRRRYVEDETASTTNVIAGPANPGYFEISYWPEGWTSEASKSWLGSGYMRIVPDPLDALSKPLSEEGKAI